MGRLPSNGARRRCRLAFLLLGTCLVLAGGSAVAAAQTPPETPPRYAALGDSYSSGQGLAPYLPGTDTADNRCHRSQQAFPAQVRHGGAAPSLDFLACSGARLGNVLPAGVDTPFGPGGRAQWNEGAAQLDRGLVNSRTTLVTLTLGGNDAELSKVLEQCAFHACLGLRIDGVPFADWLNRRIDSLAEPLRVTYQTIAERAPNARVLVVGYPQLFPRSGREQGCFSLFPWRGEQTFIRDATARLERVSGAATAAVKQAGHPVTFAGVADRFAGHEVCGSGGAWIRSPNLLDIENSFHPTAAGHGVYAATVNAWAAQPEPTTSTTEPSTSTTEPPTTTTGAGAAALSPAPGPFGDLALAVAGGAARQRCRTLAEGHQLAGARLELAAGGFRPGSVASLALTPLNGASVAWGQARADRQGRIHLARALPSRKLAGRDVLVEARGAGTDGGTWIATDVLHVDPASLPGC